MRLLATYLSHQIKFFASVFAVSVLIMGFPPSMFVFSSSAEVASVSEGISEEVASEPASQEVSEPTPEISSEEVVQTTTPATETPATETPVADTSASETYTQDDTGAVVVTEALTPVSTNPTRFVSSRRSSKSAQQIPAKQENLFELLLSGADTPFSLLSTFKIDDSTANGPTLANEDRYGVSVENIGDLNNDGVTDIAVGAHRNDTNGTDTGAVYIHFRNADNTVKSTVKIDDSTANGPTLAENDQFGVSLENIGDLNNDGVTDIAVGAYGDDSVGLNRGAVYILFLNTNGSVKSTVKIDDSTANGPVLANNDRYGVAIADIGDRDGDGVQDLAVGSHYKDSGGVDRGAWFMHFMNHDGSVKSTKVFDGTTPHGAVLVDMDYYGTAIDDIGDINHDGVSDIAVSANYDNTVGVHRGALYIHFMNSANGINSTVKIDDNTANGPTLADNDYYGTSVENMGDLDGNGVNDIAVGAESFFSTADESTAGDNKGEVFVHFMNADGSIKSTELLDENSPNGPAINFNDFYGESIANMGDLNGDGMNDMAVGAFYDDTMGTNRGAVYVHYASPIATGAGITVSKTSLDITGNGNDSFTVVLNTQPATDVVIDVSSSDVSRATVVPSTLTFTPSNWNLPQKVLVTGTGTAGDNDTATITVAVNDALSDNVYDVVADKTLTVAFASANNSGGNGGGNGGGHHGGGSSGGRIASTGEVLGASTLSCEVEPYLTRPIKLGAVNNPEDVKLLERFLNTYEGAQLPVDGIYSQNDFNAVVAWQEKYADEVLKPWGITKGTGYVFMTSLQKIKQTHKAACAQAEIETQILSCALPLLYPTQEIKVGAANNTVQVKLLEKYLNTYEGASLAVDGVYGADDIAAVRAWQGGSENVLEDGLQKIAGKHKARCALFVSTPEF